MRIGLEAVQTVKAAHALHGSMDRTMQAGACRRLARAIRAGVRYGLAGAVLAAVLAFGMPGDVQAAANPDGSVEINAENFPDETFRSYVGDTYDKDGSGTLSASEIAAVTNMNVNDKGISSLEGIAYFTSLTELRCNNNHLETLDISGNPGLSILYCAGNQLTSLNLGSSSTLERVFCGGNALTALDVSHNPNLATLVCYSNRLSSIDVRGNTQLQNLWIYDNQLTSLDVTQNASLSALMCSTNQLETLDLSNNPALRNLSVNANHLTALDLSNQTNLRVYYAENNSYTISGDSIALSALPGRPEKSRVSNVTGGELADSVLTFDDGESSMTYLYDCGNGRSMTVTINRNATPTPPTPGPDPEPDPVPQPGTDETTGAVAAAKARPCHHNYEWTTYRKATATTDGILRYTCKYCGKTLYEVPTAAYYVFNKETQEAIQNAEPGATVTVSTPIFISFHEMVADALAARSDVTLVVNYKNAGKAYEMTIPAGSGDTLTTLFGDDTYAGFLYLGGAFATVEK